MLRRAMQGVERETGRRISTVLQLRCTRRYATFRNRIQAEQGTPRYEVGLTYVTARGPWYSASWKGSEERSGGLVTNIGIHLFDVLLWLFGAVENCEVHLREPRRSAGILELQRATVRWFLSSDRADLTETATGSSFRSITVDGAELEFTDGFGDLHTRVYEDVLGGRGCGIDDARPSIELAYRIRTAPISSSRANRHPMIGDSAGQVTSVRAGPPGRSHA